LDTKVRGTIYKRNIIIKVRGDEISFTKFGACVQTGGIKADNNAYASIYLLYVSPEPVYYS